MNRFFDRVAQHVMQTVGGNLLDVHFVFPNRRGGVYFARSLNKYSNGRTIAPVIEILADCFSSLSTLEPANEMLSLFTLQRANMLFDKTHKPLTRFWNLAPLMLENMSAWDMYLTRDEVHSMLRESREWSKLGDDYSYLSKEQRKAIEEYWGYEFNEMERTHTEEWWQRLEFLYDEHRRMMTEQGYGDDGMIARDALKRLKDGSANINNRTYIFIGFNELSGVAREFFRELKSRNQAVFYWDYDGLPQPQPDAEKVVEKYAGRFKSDNLKLFPDALRQSNLASPQPAKPVVHQIAVNSKTGLSRFTTALLRLIAAEGNDDMTGTCVLLTHTDDLIPVITCLPEDMQANITMQLPLRSGNVYTWLVMMFDTVNARRAYRQEPAFYFAPLLQLLVSPLTQELGKAECDKLIDIIRRNNRIAPLLTEIDAAIGTQNDISRLLHDIYDISDGRSMLDVLRQWTRHILQAQYRRHFALRQDGTAAPQTISHEMLRALLFALNILHEQTGSEQVSEISFDIATMKQLIITYAQSVRLNFVGHPLKGVQLMGPLEARGLDFRRLIVAGAGEQSFLKPVHKQQLVPASIRYAYQMPTTEDEQAIASYNFIRLMGHVEEAYFLWDSRQSNTDRGELSHLIKILNDVYDIRPDREADAALVQKINNMPEQQSDYATTAQVPEIRKSEAVMASLGRYLNDSAPKHLSPSALNTYLDCKLRFYFKYIAGLYPENDVSEDIEATSFGTMFHSTMEQLYKPLIGKTVEKHHIEAILNDSRRINDAIILAYNNEYHKGSTTPHTPEGQYLLACEAIRNFVTGQLENDIKSAPFRLIATELQLREAITLPSGKKAYIEGTLDRVDIKDDAVRVIDYKTSRITADFQSKYDIQNPDKMFRRDCQRPSYALQTLMYTMLLSMSDEYRDIIAGKKLQPHVFMVCLKQNLHPDHDSSVMDDYNTQQGKGEAETKSDGITVAPLISIKDYFENKLKETIDEIFAPSDTITATQNAGTCLYCDFADICRTLKRQPSANS